MTSHKGYENKKSPLRKETGRRKKRICYWPVEKSGGHLKGGGGEGGGKWPHRIRIQGEHEKRENS